MPLCVGWHRAIWFFPPGITWERCLKPPGLDLAGGGGGWALATVWSYREALALVGSQLRMVTQAPLRSRLSTAVHSLKLLASSRAWELC
jgi:hypothetical protein